MVNRQVHDTIRVCDTVTVCVFIFPAAVVRLIKIITLLVHFLFLFILLILFTSMFFVFLLLFLVSGGVLIYRNKPVVVLFQRSLLGIALVPRPRFCSSDFTIPHRVLRLLVSELRLRLLLQHTVHLLLICLA